MLSVCWRRGFRMIIEAIFCRFLRDFDGLGRFGGGKITDDLAVIGFEGGLFDVGGGDLEAIKKERGLAAVNGGGQDAAEDPLQGALDGVGVFKEEDLGIQRDACRR